MCRQILLSFLYEAFSYGANQQTLSDKFEVHYLKMLSVAS